MYEDHVYWDLWFQHQMNSEKKNEWNEWVLNEMNGIIHVSWFFYYYFEVLMTIVEGSITLTLRSFSLAELAASLNIPSVSIHFSLNAKQHSSMTNEYSLPVLSRCSFKSRPNAGLELVLSDKTKIKYNTLAWCYQCIHFESAHEII